MISDRIPIRIQNIPKDSVFSLYELDWDVFAAHIESATKLFPVLERTGVKSTVCGPESFTPDHRPLMGNTRYKEIGFYFGVLV